MPPDYRTPSPDEGHEAIRAPLAQAIDDLDAQMQRLNGALLLAATTVDFAQSTLDAVTALQATAVTQAQQITDLQAAVAALQPAPAPAAT